MMRPVASIKDWRRDYKHLSRLQAKDPRWWHHIYKLGILLNILFKSYQFTIAWMFNVKFMWKFCVAIFQTIFSYLLPTKKSLKTEVVAIVGSSKGVGREIAYKLGSMRSTVICIDVEDPANEHVSQFIKMDGGKAFYFQCKFMENDQVQTTINQIKRKIGAITMFFLCCSLPPELYLFKDPPRPSHPYDVSIKSISSYVYLFEKILPQMERNGKGHIVFLSSIPAVNGTTRELEISVLQFAVQGLYESIVEKLRVRRKHDIIKTTLVHIYPFIISENLMFDVRFRQGSAFGSISAEEAADLIIDGVRREECEMSIPNHSYRISHALKVLPRKLRLMWRENIGAGVDY